MEGPDLFCRGDLNALSCADMLSVLHEKMNAMKCFEFLTHQRMEI